MDKNPKLENHENAYCLISFNLLSQTLLDQDSAIFNRLRQYVFDLEEFAGLHICTKSERYRNLFQEAQNNFCSVLTNASFRLVPTKDFFGGNAR